MNPSVLQEIIASSPTEIDLTNDLHSDFIISAAESILKSCDSISDIDKIEDELIEKNDNSLIFALLSLKIAKSKILVSHLKRPIFISLVFAVYKEHNRILNSREHPHGEDFLLKKVAQLEWLFKDQPQIDWELVVVDDGCPERSGHIAQDIIDKKNLNAKARVIFLSEGITMNHPVANTIRSTKESQKGGSITYGMWHAIQQQKKGDHIVIFTDADLSTHLGQSMLLVEPLINREKLVAIGSRREPDSVVVKKGSRNNRGKLFIST